MMSTIVRSVKCCLSWRIVLGAIACGLPAAVWACDTPVYRYALCHWTPAPYHVVYFKQGTASNSAGEISRFVSKLGEGDTAANLVFDTFDPAHDKMESLPESVQAAWNARKEAKPAYMVLTPQGVEIFAGRLEASMLRPMTDSPVRRKLCQQLEDGKALVFLLVPGKDAAENRRARKAVEDLVAQAGAAAQSTPHAPREGVRHAERDEHGAGVNRAAPMNAGTRAAPGSSSGAKQPGPGEDPPAATPPIELGLIEVSRSDPAEKWLIRAMMTIEPDLAGLVDQPMVFGVFGRARVLEPFVGKGITVDNLSQLVDFVTGACSCQVKDANPGVDLLTSWNWDRSAERLIAKGSPLDGPGGGYAEVATKVPSGSKGNLDNPSVRNALRGVPGTGDRALGPVPDRRASSSSPVVSTAGQAGSGTRSTRPGITASPQRLPATAVPASPGADVPASFAHRLAWRLGLGLLLGAVVVLAAGLVLVRHRGPM
jgi:hypothetical protein